MGILGGIGNILGGIGNDIGSAVSSIGSDIGGAVSGGVQSAENVGSDLLSGNIGGAVQDGISGIGNFFGTLFGGGAQPAAQPFSPPATDPSGFGLGPEIASGPGGSGGAGGAGGFDGNFNDLSNGADFNNANSLLGVQTQADQQQTLMELAAKLESIQKETDQAISQDM